MVAYAQDSGNNKPLSIKWTACWFPIEGGREVFPRKVKANGVNKKTKKKLATSKKDFYETGFRRKWLLLQVWLAQVTYT